ncbi:MAG: hypothetical protein RLW62_06290 [Gammaproteobacteria bacterium]
MLHRPVQAVAAGALPDANAYRPAYSTDDPAVDAAITPALLAHRDFIYEQHLELPIVF